MLSNRYLGIITVTVLQNKLCDYRCYQLPLFIFRAAQFSDTYLGIADFASLHSKGKK